MSAVQSSANENRDDLTVESINDFGKMNLNHELLKGIFAYGFEKPSQIQSQAIIPVTTGRDCVVQAQSGTGKTGTFCIGTLQQIDTNINAPQVLMISPTRELARQTEEVAKALGSFMGITTQLLVGGTRVADDEAGLRRGVQVVVGTPGRIQALFDRETLDMTRLKCIVLDEADQLLSGGFLEAVQFFLTKIPPTAQLAIFSATLPQEIVELTKKCMNDPVRILVKTEQVSLEGIRQYNIVGMTEDDKYPTLCDLFETLSLQQTIVYANTRRAVEDLVTRMTKDNFVVSCIHADMNPEARTKAMEEFRSNRARVLISTDLTARGIDVQTVSLVINYEIPRDVHSYIHRVGRSGRFGRKGTAINFVSDRDERDMRAIEEYYQTKTMPLPANIANLLD